MRERKRERDGEMERWRDTERYGEKERKYIVSVRVEQNEQVAIAQKIGWVEWSRVGKTRESPKCLLQRERGIGFNSKKARNKKTRDHQLRMAVALLDRTHD